MAIQTSLFGAGSSLVFPGPLAYGLTAPAGLTPVHLVTPVHPCHTLLFVRNSFLAELHGAP